MVRADSISDELWSVLVAVMPQDTGRPGRPWNDHRLTLEGIIWRFRTGSPWRDVPEEFGSYQSVWERHSRWSRDGTYEAMLDAVRTAFPESQDALALLSIDSTVVRAHQHAAGARRDSVTAAQDDTGGRIELHEIRGWAAAGAA